MDGHGGTVIDDNGILAKKIKKLIREEYEKNPREDRVRLYLEIGVYNFYVKVGKNGSIAPLEDAAPEPADPSVKTLAGMIKKLGEKEKKALCQELPGFPWQPCA